MTNHNTADGIKKLRVLTWTLAVWESRLAAHPGGHPCPGLALRDRHLQSRRAHRSNGFCPLQTLIGASFLHANAALSLTQNRQSPANLRYI